MLVHPQRWNSALSGNGLLGRPRLAGGRSCCPLRKGAAGRACPQSIVPPRCPPTRPTPSSEASITTGSTPPERAPKALVRLRNETLAEGPQNVPNGMHALRAVAPGEYRTEVVASTEPDPADLGVKGSQVQILSARPPGPDLTPQVRPRSRCPSPSRHVLPALALGSQSEGFAYAAHVWAYSFARHDSR